MNIQILSKTSDKLCIEYKWFCSGSWIAIFVAIGLNLFLCIWDIPEVFKYGWGPVFMFCMHVLVALFTLYMAICEIFNSTILEIDKSGELRLTSGPLPTTRNKKIAANRISSVFVGKRMTTSSRQQFVFFDVRVKLFDDKEEVLFFRVSSEEGEQLVSLIKRFL